MKKGLFLIVSFVMLAGALFAQDTTYNNADNHKNCPEKTHDNHLALYLNIIGGGYTHWSSKFPQNENDYSLTGNGLNTGPNVSLYYVASERFKIGVNGVYLFTWINNIDPENGLSEDVFDQDDNHRELLTAAGSVQYSFISSKMFDLALSVDGGTFWFNNDDFSERTKSRYFGSAGLLFEFKLSEGFSVFASPDYLLYKYKLENGNSSRKSYIHNFDGNLGFAFKL